MYCYVCDSYYYGSCGCPDCPTSFSSRYRFASFPGIVIDVTSALERHGWEFLFIGDAVFMFHCGGFFPVLRLCFDRAIDYCRLSVTVFLGDDLSCNDLFGFTDHGVCDLSDTEIDVSSFVKIDYSLFPNMLADDFVSMLEGELYFILLTSGIESDTNATEGLFWRERD